MEKDRIYNGDSRDLLKSIETESVDLIVSDIPYSLTQGGCATGDWASRQMGGGVK